MQIAYHHSGINSFVHNVNNLVAGTIQRFMVVRKPGLSKPQANAFHVNTSRESRACLLMVPDIVRIANNMRKEAGKTEMPYYQVLAAWRDIRVSDRTYDATGMAGNAYVFTPALAHKIAEAISTVEYRRNRPRKPKDNVIVTLCDVT